MITHPDPTQGQCMVLFPRNQNMLPCYMRLCQCFFFFLSSWFPLQDNTNITMPPNPKRSHVQRGPNGDQSWDIYMHIDTHLQYLNVGDMLLLKCALE